jgi:hypothetical protein
MLKIKGVAITTPKIFKVGIQDIDGETERNAAGDLLRDRITTKRKLECEWGPLEMSEISTLLKAVTDVYFSVDYPDPMDGVIITKTFYVGDRTAPMYLFDETKNRYMWQGLSMNFVEQ